MWSKQQAVDYALSQVGLTDGGLYFKIAFGYRSSADWCAAFDSAIVVLGKLDCPYFPNTFAFDKRDLGIIGNRWVEPNDLEVGDFISFDFDGGGQYGGDHVGIVVRKYGRGDYLTIEGNCGSAVRQKHRTIENTKTYNADGSLRGIGIIGGIRPKYNEPVFSDVSDDTPHYTDIKWLKERGITTGFIDGSFRPNADTARGDMAAFLHRLSGTSIFKDVNLKTAHVEDIWWLAAKGVSTGFADGTFRPSKAVTRADMAAFLCRFVNGPTFAYEPSSSDVQRFSDVDWQTPHCREVWWMAHMGISTGYPDGTFRPNAALKRCDAAAFLHRVDGLAGV